MPTEPQTATHSFDLFRLMQSQKEVGISYKTIRAWGEQGFTGIYRRGKAVFVSRSELAEWIKGKDKLFRKVGK